MWGVSIKYANGDGNDIIEGFNLTSTLSISGSKYSTIKSDDDIIVTVGEGKISLIGAANLSTVHIEGLEDSSSDSKLITLTAGNDNYSNTVEGATINALDGDDTILNEGGASVSINGGAGNDSIINSGANVVFNYAKGDGNDSIKGFNATSILSITGSAYSTAKSGSDIVVTVGSNKITLAGAGTLSKANIVDATTLILNDKSSAAVTLASAVKTGDASKRTKAIKIIGNALANILNGGASNDTLSGAAGNDKLYGGAGNDNLSGGTGSDTLSGGSGNDTLTGGKGHDLFIYSAGNDVIADFAAGDKISIGAAISGTSIKGSDATFTINKNTLTVKNGKGKEVTFINAKGKEQTLIGGALIVSKSATLENWREVGDASTATAKVKLTGNAKNNTLFGSSKDDTLIGAVGADKLFGNAGNDSLSGGDGADTLSGGAGNDKLYGGKGNDSLWGGAGNDSLWGNAGADTFIYANGEGKDVIYNFDNSDILQITGTFTSSYNKSKKEIAFTVGKTTSALTLKSFTTTSFNINGDTYKISGSKLIK